MSFQNSKDFPSIFPLLNRILKVCLFKTDAIIRDIFTKFGSNRTCGSDFIIRSQLCNSSVGDANRNHKQYGCLRDKKSILVNRLQHVLLTGNNKNYKLCKGIAI